MGDNIYRERIEALTFNNDEASWWPDRTQPGPGDLRTDVERLAFIDGCSASKRDAAAIAADADAEIGEAQAAVDPDIDRGLPLHERIAILRMQRDSFAQFAEEVAKIVGMEGEGGNDVLDAVKGAVSERDEAISTIATLRAKADKANRARVVLAHWLALLTGVEERQIAAAAWEAKDYVDPIPGFLSVRDIRPALATKLHEIGNALPPALFYARSLPPSSAHTEVVVSGLERISASFERLKALHRATISRGSIQFTRDDIISSLPTVDDLSGIMDGHEMMPNDGERVRGGGDE